MEMARACILDGNINDNLWSEVILAMTHIKNILPTNALGGISPHESQFNEPPDVSHMRVLSSTVYVLIHEEEQDLKSEKFEARAWEETLVGYDEHMIYKVYIHEQGKVIRVKNLCIFEDTFQKDSNTLLAFDDQPTFQGFPADQDTRDSTDSASNDGPSKRQTKSTKLDKTSVSTSPKAITSRLGRQLKPEAKARKADVATAALIT